MATEVIASDDLGQGVEVAKVVKNGHWLFCNGMSGLSEDIAAQLDSPYRAYSRRPIREVESEELFDRVATGLELGGGSVDNIVKLDQYYASGASVDPYHTVRKERLTTRVPPSTSIIMQQLAVPNSAVQLDVIAYVDAGANYSEAHSDDVPAPPPTSGYTPALSAGDYIFVAGQMAVDMHGTRIVPEVVAAPDVAFDPREVRNQSRYVIDKLLATLGAAGGDAASVAKAEVYLSDLDDLADFEQVWGRFFPRDRPARSVVQCSGLALRRGMVEVNFIAGRSGSGAATRLSSGRALHLPGEASSVRLGELVFLSGVMAATADGADGAGSAGGDVDRSLAAAEADHYRRSVAAVEAEVVADLVEAELARHGLDLSDVTRIKQYHRDLRDFPATSAVWARRMSGPVPLTGVECPRLPLAGRRIMVDVTAVARPAGA